jgi:hypothetical protein
VEVKGPGDRSRPAQNDHHSDLAAKLGTFVHRVTVKLDDDPLSAYSVFQLVWLTEKMASRVKGDRGRPEILWQPVKSLRGGEGGHGIEFYRAGISHPIAFLDGYEWRDKPDAVATVYILESSASSDALRDAFQAIAYFLRFQRTGPFHGSVKPFPCISIFANA